MPMARRDCLLFVVNSQERVNKTDHSFRDNSLQNTKAPGVSETRLVRKQLYLPAANAGTAGYDILTMLLILKQPIKNEGSVHLSKTQTLQSSGDLCIRKCNPP